MATRNVSFYRVTFLVDREELMAGIKNRLNVMLSREESHLLINYLDSDKSGLIDF